MLSKAAVSEQQIVDRLRAAGCVFAEDEARLLIEAAESDAQLESLVTRRVAGLPLEQLLGWAEFCGLRILVGEGVFVPRRRTEFLVELAMPFLRPGAVVLDLCCGSGAVGAALAAREQIDLYATDIEPAAVACARRNVEPLGARVFEGDLFDAVPVSLVGRVEILAVNAPYVPTDEIANMPQEARLFEPRVTLDGGADGLDVHRRIAAGAVQWLAPSACLLIETSKRQSRETAAIFESVGFAASVRHSAKFDATVVVARRR